MKRSLYIILTTILAFASVNAFGQEKKPVFKKYYWGTPYEEIQAGEYREGTFGPGTITFSDVVAGLECNVTYKLVNGRLNEVYIIFTNTHEIEEENGFYKDFEAVNEYLNLFYGQPLFCGPNWKTSEDVKKEEIDKAMLEGKVSFIGRWQSKTASVLHYLTARNLEFEHIVTIK